MSLKAEVSDHEGEKQTNMAHIVYIEDPFSAEYRNVQLDEPEVILNEYGT